MKTFFRIAGVTAFVLTLAACQGNGPGAAQASANMQLKLYQVPAQQSDQITHALHNTLAGNTLGGLLKKQDNGMRVTEPFPGTVMVLAPPKVQASVGSVIHELSEHAPKPQPHKAEQAGNIQFRVHFWLVDMLPGSGTDTSALKPLAPTLDALRKRMGQAHFALTDNAQAVTESGDKAHNLDTANHHHFQFWIPSTEGNRAQLVLRYVDQTGEGFSLKTSAYMPLGDYMVLAQAAAPSELPDHRKALPQGTMRLLVVRVDKLTAHAAD